VTSTPRQQFFQHDLAQGSLRRADDQRVAGLSVDFVQALHVAIIEQFGDNAQDVLYRSGYEWGLQDMVRLNQQLRTQFGNRADLWQMESKSVLESWWTPHAEAGWGRCEFDLTSLARGVVFVDLRESAVVSALSASDQPICHLYAGLFASVFSFFERTERHAVEVQCSAVGAPFCQFVIGPGVEVDSAETWRQQGAAPADILRRLR
jgi:predicted hydrocarbon binding protein